MPPAIIGAVVAIAASAAAYAGLIAATTAMVIGALAMAAGTLLTKTPSFSDYTSQSERKQVLRSSAAALTRIYGTTETSGVLFFAEEEEGESTKEWVHLAIAVAGHPVDGYDTVYLGDEEIGTYGDLVSYELHSDRRAADPFMLEHCPSWKEDMIGVGITWLRVSLKFDAEKFPSGLPNIKLVLRGSRVYDPRDGVTKHSDNAALVILDYYRNALGVPDSDILWEEFKAAANLCDEVVTNADGSTERRYTINGEFDVSEAPAKILEAMHEACAGSPTYVAGKHGLLVGAYYGPAVNEIHDHQIIGNVEIVPETAFRDRVNTITGTFIDPEDHYSETDFPAVSVAQWVEEDGGEISEDMDLRFVCSPYQAQRLANIRLRKKRSGRTIKLPMNFGGFAYRPGSYVRLYIPALGIAGAEFRVAKWEFAVTSGIKLTLQEESAEVWDDAIGQPFERAALTNLPTGGPAAPDNLTYTTEVVGEVVQGVLSWTNAGSQIAYNQVVVSRDGETVSTVQCPGQSCRLSGLPSGDYLAQVRAVAVSGAQSALAGLAFTIAVPPVPASVTVEAGNWSLTLRPQFATAAAFGTVCEFWWSTQDLAPADVETLASHLGVASYMTINGLQPNTDYFFWVRSVNAYGKSALLPVTGKTTYDPASVIAILDNQIGAEQLREALRTQIELIPGLSDNADQVAIDLADLQAALTALDEREAQVTDLLQTAQTQLGNSYINVTVIQDQLRAKIDKYSLDFQDFRNAVFSIDPTTGEITMDAVNAVRSELGADITAVSQHLDAVEAIVNTCVTRAELATDLERITSVEQAIDGINASLTQTATKSEVTAVSATVTQVQQGLDAANAALTQKAAQAQVDAHGQRLSAAEQQISANTTATTANAQRIEQVKAALEQADSTISAGITALEQAMVSADQAMASRLTGLEATAGNQAAQITELQQAVTGDGESLASKFEQLTASTNTAAEAALGNAIANANADLAQRQAAGKIRREQSVMATEQAAQAQTIEQLTAQLNTVNAELTAQILTEKTARTTEDESLAQSIQQLTADYKAADSVTSAAIQSEETARANADGALSTRIDTAQAKADSAAAAVQSEATARANADGALSTRIDTAQATANNATAAVQTVSTAQATTAGQLSALWATKAQVAGAVSGFGLEVTLNADGSVVSSFVIDADVFAVLSRATGAASKIHPFVIKNGVVYINKAMMDSADINSLVANYISVTELVGLNIKGSTISGTNIIGGSLNIGAGKAIINAAGKATLQDADITGKVTANSGTLRNVTVEEDCTVKGTIYADKIVGDVAMLFRLAGQVSEGATTYSVTLPASARARSLYVTGVGIEVYSIGVMRSSRITVSCSGQSAQVFELKNNGYGLARNHCHAIFDSIPAGTSPTVTITISGDYTGIDWTPGVIFYV